MTAATSPKRPSIARDGGETVGYLDEMSMLRGFVEAFATACAEGIPVSLRGSVRNYQIDGRTHVIDERALARDRLGRDLASTRQRLANALGAVERAKDEMVLTMMVRQAEERARHLRQIEQELEALDSAPEPAPPPTFRTVTDVLLAALANIVNNRRLSREEHAAFRALVPSVTLERCDDSTWTAEAVVQLLVVDGLAELGPVSWKVSSPGMGAAATRAIRRSAKPNGTRFVRHELRQALEAEAGLASEAARLLTATPFPELPHLMLHVRAGHALPDWITDEWRQPRFLEHLQAVYGVEPGLWTGPRLYGRRMPRAQAVVDCAADAGRLTLAGYREVIPGVDANEMWIFARSGPGRLRAPVVDQHVEADGSRSLSNRVCRCGRPALIVAHAPELPGSLLCGCGLALDAEPGSTADGLVFPSAYQAMRVSRPQWMRDLRRTCGQLHDELSEVSVRQAQILGVLLQDPYRSWRASKLATLTGMSQQTCHWNLHQLRRREFVWSEGCPANFMLVDAEAALAVLSRSTKRRPAA